MDDSSIIGINSIELSASPANLKERTKTEHSSETSSENLHQLDKECRNRNLNLGQEGSGETRQSAVPPPRPPPLARRFAAPYRALVNSRFLRQPFCSFARHYFFAAPWKIFAASSEVLPHPLIFFPADVAIS